MADITLNSAVRSNLRTLQSTTDLMNRTEQRLSTGKKVNSAFDNPGNFFTAKSLNNRASDLNNLLDSVSSSVKTIEAADNGISAISDLVTQLKSSARSAQQSTSAVTTKASFTSSVISGATESNLIASTPTANKVGTAVLNQNTTPANMTDATVLGGSGAADRLDIAAGDTLTFGDAKIKFYATAAAATADSAEPASTIKLDLTQTVADLRTAINTATQGSTAISAGALTVTGSDVGQFSGTAAAKIGLASTTDTAGTARTSPLIGKTLTVSVAGAAAKEITFGTGDGKVDTLDELNTELNKMGARASLSSDGKLSIETTNENAAQSLKIGGTAVDTAATAAAKGSGKIFDLESTAKQTATAETGGDGKTTRTNYMNDYNDVRSQISKLAKDASFNGVNLLSGDDLTVIFNETGSSTLDVSGVDIMDRLGLSAISFDDFADSSKIDDVVEKLNTALNTLDSLSSRFGSQLSVVQTRQDFTKDMIGTLEDGADALTNADTNAEAANLATLQTRQSLIVSSLSISTGQEQNVLQLLR